MINRLTFGDFKTPKYRLTKDDLDSYDPYVVPDWVFIRAAYPASTGTRHRTNGVITDLVVKAANNVIGRFGITGVGIGVTDYGCTNMVLGGFSDTVTHDYADVNPAFHLSYSDARKGIKMIAGVVVKEVNTAIKVEKPWPVLVNRLLPGSGVYCEHCEAEVHPDCEICPSCGNNITEWVD